MIQTDLVKKQLLKNREFHRDVFHTLETQSNKSTVIVGHYTSCPVPVGYQSYLTEVMTRSEFTHKFFFNPLRTVVIVLD
jgi:hypothetical protein